MGGWGKVFLSCSVVLHQLFKPFQIFHRDVFFSKDRFQGTSDIVGIVVARRILPQKHCSQSLGRLVWSSYEGLHPFVLLNSELPLPVREVNQSWAVGFRS